MGLHRFEPHVLLKFFLVATTLPTRALAVSAAYAPSAVPVARLLSSRPAARTAAAPDMLFTGDVPADILRVTLALPTMYALMSVNEYATHRYFQHLEFNRPETFPTFKELLKSITKQEKAPTLSGDGHVEHHAETYDDMSLKYDENWRKTKISLGLDEDVYRGTAFKWKSTGLMTLQMLPSVLPTYALMGWSVPETVAFLLPCMVVHALIWNGIHPPMHGLSKVPLSDGIPSEWAFKLGLQNTAYWRYIFDNHMGHHVFAGQCNYNVCCPMTDHLLGTYMPPSEWKTKMRPLPENAEIRGPVVAYDGVPVPPMTVAASMTADGVAPTVLKGGGAILDDAYSQ